MKKFTGSYANTETNFVIMNLNSNKSIDCDITYSIICVVQNILQRGNVTVPSILLQTKLGALNENIFENPCHLISKERVEWNNIKGDINNSNYPAETFFNLLLDKYFNEYSYVRNLIVPEAEFSEVLGHSTAFDGQQVDFFIPQIKTVIEIDGYSHKDSMQIEKDILRDRELTRNNIAVFRITTDDLKSENKNFKQIMNQILEKIKSSELINSYQYPNEENNLRVKYDTIFRLQMAFIECMKTGIIRKNAGNLKIKITSHDIIEIEDLALLAYEDICTWIKAIAELVKVECIFPTLVIEKSENTAFCMDISLFKKYTDTTINDTNTIYIRSDYFCDNYYYKISTAKMLKYSFSESTDELDMNSLHFLLKNIFGFDRFNEGQLPIIKNILERHDTIGILPTGGGKSLTYQFCALLQPGITVVIEPILSLIQDQKKSMDRIHFNRTSYISSSLNGDEKSIVIDNLGQGKYQMIWCSPERFQNKEFRNAFACFENDTPLSTAVIDEVHCLSEWGHDFRISYLALIGTIRQYCPDACLLGLTATASQAVLEDLKIEFDDDGTNIKALTSMNRDELLFKRIIVDNDHERLTRIIEIVDENNTLYTNQDGTCKKKAGLIFCPTVKGKKSSSCESVSYAIQNSDLNLRISEYHGQLHFEDKNSRQNQFMNGELDLMICTKAFGMGIDKDNVKYTIHSSMPQSVESFYQEAGRAGREPDKSVKSNCYIIYSPEKLSEKNIIDKIFDINTDVNERNDLSRNLSEDLSTWMYFWNVNRKTVDEEYLIIRHILMYFYNKQFEINFGKENLPLTDIQDALYRMYLLGIIDNWSIKYYSLSEGVVEVDFLEINEQRMYKRLLFYIHKYDPEFQIDTPSTRYKKYYTIINSGKKRIPQIFKCLIEWSNDNIIYNRLQSTFTMMQWMSPEITDEQFRSNIVEYFKFSEITVLFDNVIHNPLDYNIWFDIIKSNVIVEDESINTVNIDNANSCLSSLQRYLESYRNNTGLNYISGMLRIMTEQFVGSEGQWRFSNALHSIQESLDENSINEILDNTLNIAKFLSLEDKDILSKEIIDVFPDSAYKTFTILEDRYSLSLLLENSVGKLTYILKEIL